MVVLPRRPAMLDSRITEPPPSSAICGSTILVSQKVPLTLVSMILSQASSVISEVGPYTGLVAALHTSTSMRPQVSRVLLTRFCRSSFLPTWQGTAMASKPWALSPAATCSQASALRLDTTTLAPQRASSSTMERPMPLVEPVTRATFPVRSNSGLLMVCPLTSSPDIGAFPAWRWCPDAPHPGRPPDAGYGPWPRQLPGRCLG